MTQRIDFTETDPNAFKALLRLQACVNESGLERSLLELIKMRASQINGCAYCLDMHSKDARAQGETEQRLYLLDAWHEAPFYSDRERAALAWTEAVTRLEGPVADDVYEAARSHFTEQELTSLTFAIVAINGWNRLSIAFRVPPGTSQPAASQAPKVAGRQL